MKTFSDLLAIESVDIPINVNLSPIAENGYPCVNLTINGALLFSGEIKEEKSFAFSCALIDHVDVQIELADKKYSQEKETAVIVEKLEVDGVSIVPKFNHLIEYINDHGKTVHSNYMGYNGVWRFQTGMPFYRWLHQATGKGWLID